MTWSLMQRLLSGEGGFGLAYGDLGFRPEPILAREGCYDLICGRPYCNLTREPLMYAHGLPLEHPYKHLKAHPENASTSRPVLNQARMGPRFWLQFPLQFLRSLFGWLRLHHVRRNLVELLNEHVFPQFDELTAQEAGEDLGPLPSSALMDRLQEWARLTLVEFARHGLKPAILAEITLQHVGRAIAHSLGRDRARGATVRLATGVRLDPATDLAAALRRVARGECTQDDFLNQFGHRCWNELELSQPRWAEDPGALAGMLSDRTEEPVAESATGDTLAEIAVVAGLKAAQREALADTVRDLQTYLALREAAKHRLVKGLAAVRRCLVELDRRYDLRGGIFFLTVADLPRLLAGEDLRPLIRERRRRRAAVLALDVPTVLFSDDLEAIGRPPARPDANSFFGIPLSAGVAEGPALVLYEPDQAGAVADGFILVCPSTDPAWVPLMIRARGLVVETGGVLSHGAIVARELGLPAVGALTYATQVLHDGKHLRVDGTAGTVTVLDQ